MDPKKYIPNKTLTDIYIKNLKNKGVRIPKKGKLRVALDLLFININKGLHIDTIKTHVKNQGFTLKGGDPLQVRHLSTQYGWYIIKEDKYIHKLNSITECLPGFITNKRTSKLNELNWMEMKKEYEFKCATCGNIEGKPMRYKKTQITILQQGHMDPRKDLTLDNCIPQCSGCNQPYKNKAIFNKMGQITNYDKNGFS